MRTMFDAFDELREQGTSEASALREIAFSQGHTHPDSIADFHRKLVVDRLPVRSRARVRGSQNAQRLSGLSANLQRQQGE